MALSQKTSSKRFNIFVWPSSVHGGYRVSFDLTVPGRRARSEAYELRWRDESLRGTKKIRAEMGNLSMEGGELVGW